MHHSCLKSCILFSTLILELVCSSFFIPAVSVTVFWLPCPPPPAFKNFRFHSYLFLQRMCLHGCHSISKMTRTWQQLFSWSMSFLPVHALSIQRFGDFLFAAEIQQKTTVFILLNNEKLFVGQNTICEDVTLATGSLF